MDDEQRAALALRLEVDRIEAAFWPLDELVVAGDECRSLLASHRAHASNMGTDL